MSLIPNPAHVGWPRTIEIKGFRGIYWDYNGEYDIKDAPDSDDGKPEFNKRTSSLDLAGVSSATVKFSQSYSGWVLFTNDGKIFKAGLPPSQRMPMGPWREANHNIAVLPSSIKPSMIATLAFPAPRIIYDFYLMGGSVQGVTYPPLLPRPDFVMLETSQGERIPAVHVKQPNAKFTIIYSHGNGEDIGILLKFFDDLARNVGANVLAYDYVGYSLSRLEGMAPSEDGCYRSVDAAWRYLTINRHVQPEHIVLFGRSIGSGPTCDMASWGPGLSCGGVILQSPLSSCARVLFGDAGLLARPLDPFPNYAKVDRICAPVAIMHGVRDSVVPISHGKTLFSLCKNPFEPLWLDNSGHDNIPFDQTFTYVQEFLESLETSPRIQYEDQYSSWTSCVLCSS